MAEKPQEQDEAIALAQSVKVDANIQLGIKEGEFTEPEWLRIARWLFETFGTQPLNEWIDARWATFNERLGELVQDREVIDRDWVKFVYRELLTDPPQGPFV